MEIFGRDTEEVFSREDEQLKGALQRVCGDSFEDNHFRCNFVHVFITPLQQGKLAKAEMLMYSRRVKEQFPRLFQTLPLWRLTQCEARLALLADREETDVVMVWMQLPGMAVANIAEVGDIGEVLFRYKKLPHGDFGGRDSSKESKISDLGGLVPA